ncbi:oocyte zinc finger protein XlCOF15 isoform X2 [Bactrocera oleae]|nr:oocyte zinc finger protein XlCOF15 isoform X2 [Bactrocera oleae]XP_036216458.1 oocyte zinc finger protein XlCOF15 isoform X2 [Bactrocera oleae]
MLHCSEFDYENGNFTRITALDVKIVKSNIVLCEQDSGFKDDIELLDDEGGTIAAECFDKPAIIRRKKGRPPKRYNYQFKCEQCDFVTAYAKYFRTHLSQTHKDDSMRIFKCTQCPEAYVEERFLHEHVKYLHDCVPRQPKFICTKCGKGFPKQSHLTRHSYVHDPAKKPFLCDRCPMRFTNQSTLNRHIEAKHIEHKVHTCADCGKAFGHIYGLKAHRIRLHKMEF